VADKGAARKGGLATIGKRKVCPYKRKLIEIGSISSVVD